MDLLINFFNFFDLVDGKAPIARETFRCVRICYITAGHIIYSFISCEKIYVFLNVFGDSRTMLNNEIIKFCVYIETFITYLLIHSVHRGNRETSIILHFPFTNKYIM